MNNTLENKLNGISTQPGVYLFKNSAGKVLYVGKANNLRSRVRSYFQNSRQFDPKTGIMLQKVSDLETILVDNEVEALILESNLVKKYKPRYNINLKDDKSFPYIRITNEIIPQIFVTRKVVKDGSKYFGPYTDVKQLRYILRSVRKIFPIRSCRHVFTKEIIEKKKIKLCLDYHIHRCEGPCQGLVEPKKYQQMITLVETFLKGKTKDLITELREKMEAESRELNFENAARIRDQIKLIENYHFSAQKVVLTDMEDRDVIALATEEPDACIVVFKIRDGKVIGRQHFYLDRIEGKSFSEILEHFLQQYYLETDYYPGQILLPEKIENEDTFLKWLEKQAQHKVELLVPQIGEKKKLISLCQKNAKYLLNELMEQKQKGKEYVANSVKLLQKNLNLKKPPKHIEAFDISNIQGKEAVASMVYFWNGQPRKSEYRKFKIKSKETPDDFAMMREVVFRRYRRLLNEGIDLPDLILVDGGKGQLSTALQVLSELGIQDQPIIGLAKKLEEVFLPGLSDPQNIPKNSPGLRLLQHIRDEAHRFAIAYHRKLRDKKAIRSPLDDIPGIGSKRRTDLLKTFGSLKNIRNSSLEDLIKKGKIPKNVAILLSQKLQENYNAKDK